MDSPVFLDAGIAVDVGVHHVAADGDDGVNGGVD
jgi:hypothetical protein